MFLSISVLLVITINRDEGIRGWRADMVCSLYDGAKSQVKGWLTLRILYSTAF